MMSAAMNGIRSQAGCLPVRWSNGTVEVLLVTSRYTGEWIVPKGTIEPGESAERAALREAEEEAGVRGRLIRRLGFMRYPRGSQVAIVDSFLLEVEEELATWPEQELRQRRWFRLDEAVRAVRRPEVLTLLQELFLEVATQDR